jgi:lipopolysaccharide export system protein LptA
MTVFRIFILLTALISSLSAAGGISLVHADLTLGRMESGQQVTVFYGNVHFRQDTLDMFCDSAKYYEKQKYADFDSNVLVLDGQRKLRSERIEYYPEKKTAYCYGRVQIVSDTDSMYAESLIYNFKTKNAKAAVNFYARDEKEQVDVRSERGEYTDSIRLFLVEGNALLSRVDTAADAKDTLYIYAQKIEYFAIDSAKAIASDSVTILQKELTAKSDSAVYFVKEQIIWLKKDPFALYENNELSGNVIKVTLDSMRIKKIYSFGKARALEPADSLSGKYNKLEAKTIELQIVDNKPHLMVAGGNAVSRYYLKNKEGGQGFNKASADTLKLFFSNGEMDSLGIFGGSEGVYYPENYQGEIEGE